MKRRLMATAAMMLLALWVLSPFPGLAASALPEDGQAPPPSPTDEGGQPPAPAISLSPDFGPPAETIVISGKGFTPLAAVSIYWDRSLSPSITQTLGAINPTVGADGTFVLSFTAPKSPAGAHVITARDSAGLEAGAGFRIIPKISLSPDSGASGDAITIEGNGFTPSAAITILWDKSAPPADTILGTGPSTGTDGSFTVSFIVPKAAAGAHTLTARDSAGLEAGAVFTIEAPSIASLTLEPSVGVPGTIVKASGKGFTPLAAISLRWDESALTPANTDIYESDVLLSADSLIRAGKDGSFTISFKVPGTASPGIHTLTARDSAGIEARASFEVEAEKKGEIIPPLIALDPSSGLPGDSVQINGIGFAPAASLSLYWDGALLPEGNAQQTDSKGAFAARFIVPPSSSAGYHAVRAQDTAGKEASAVFLVRTPGSKAAISVEPASGFPGDSVEIAGSGFTPSSAIGLYWDGAPIPEANAVTAGPDGSFTATMTVPRASSGPHTIGARSGTGAEATADFYIKVLTGAVLTLGSPTGMPGDRVNISGSGFSANQTIDLDWDGMIALGAFSTDTNGDFSGTIAVPDTAAGFHIVNASDAALGIRSSAVFVIPGTAGPPGEPGLPGEPCADCGTPVATTGVAGAALALAATALGLIVLGKFKKWLIG